MSLSKMENNAPIPPHSYDFDSLAFESEIAAKFIKKILKTENNKKISSLFSSFSFSLIKQNLKTIYSNSAIVAEIKENQKKIKKFLKIQKEFLSYNETLTAIHHPNIPSITDRYNDRLYRIRDKAMADSLYAEEFDDNFVSLSKIYDHYHENGECARSNSRIPSENIRFDDVELQMNFFGSVMGSELSNSAEIVMEELSSFLKDAKNVLPELHTSAKGVSSVAKNLDEIIATAKSDGFRDYVSNFVTEAKTEVSSALSVKDTLLSMASGFSLILLAAATVHYVTSEPGASKNLLILSLLVACYFNKESLSTIFAFFSGRLQLMESVETQGGDYFSDAASASILFLAPFVMKTKGLAKLPATIMEMINNFDRSRTNLQSILTFILSCVEYLMDNLHLSEYVPPWARRVNIADPEAKALLLELDEVSKAFYENKIEMTTDNGTRFYSLRGKINKFISSVPNNKDTSNMIATLRAELFRLDKILDKFRSLNASGDSKRIEPAYWNIVGCPGIFKTQATEHVCAELLLDLCNKEELLETQKNRNRYVYWRYPEMKYHDTLKGDEKIMIADDYNQFKTDPSDADNIYADIMRAVGETPYAAHKADVGSKGNTYIRYSYIITTSNAAKVEIPSLLSAEAFARRMHLATYMVPKPEYCTKETVHNDVLSRKLDFSNPNLPKGPDGLVATDPMLLHDFYRYNPLTFEVTDRLTFDQCIRLLKEMRATRVAYFDQKHKEITQRFNNNKHDVEFQNSDPWDVIIDNIRADLKAPEVAIEFNIEDMNLHNFVDVLKKHPTHPKSQMVFRRLKNMMWIVAANNPGVMNEATSAEEFLIRFHSFEGDTILQNLAHAEWNYTDYVLTNSSRISENYKDAVLSICTESFTERLKTCILDTFSASVKLAKGMLYDVFSRAVTWIRGNMTWIAIFIVALGATGFVARKIYQNASGPTYKYDPDKKVIRLYQPGEAGGIADYGQIPDGSTVIVQDKTEELGDVVLNYPWDDDTKHAPGKKGRKARANIRKNQKWASQFSHPDIDFEMGLLDDPNGAVISDKIIAENAMNFSVQTTENGDYHHLGQVLLIKDRLALIPYHYYTILTNKTKNDDSLKDRLIRFQRINSGNDGTLEWFMSIREFLNPENFKYTESSKHRDQAIIRLPLGARRFRNITKFVATNKDHEGKEMAHGVLKGLHGITVYATVVRVQAIDKIDANVGTDTQCSIHGVYTYIAQTTKGDCGSILFLENKRNPTAKIFGMHSAGSKTTGYGFSSRLSREDLFTMLSLYDISDNIVIQGADDISIPVFHFHNDNFSDAHLVEQQVRSSSKTQIVPSELHGKWGPPATMPAFLHSFENSEGEKVRPWTLAYSKIQPTTHYLNPVHLSAVRDSLLSSMMRKSLVAPLSKHILTFDEAIVGTDTFPKLTKLSRSTSPGYPFVMDPNKMKIGGKKYWFGNDEEYDITNERVDMLRNEVCDTIQLARDGIRNTHIFVDALKDERRPIEKVMSGKTRLFNIGPMILNITMKMYFGAFCDWFIANHTANGSAIGVNPMSYDWQSIKNHATQFGEDNIGAGDFSGYDGKMRADVLWHILYMINQWYSDSQENQLIRKVLWCEIVNSLHISGSVQYSWNGSNPSGNGMTAIINTLYCLFSFRYSYLAFRNFNMGFLTTFDDYVYVISLGDDNLFGVDDSIKEGFNEMTLGYYMALIGLTYTTETKGVATVPLRNISQVGFLKRKFLESDSAPHTLCPLELGVVLEMAYWTKNYDKTNIMNSNVEATLVELSLHGEKVFNTYAPPIIAASYETGYYPRNINFFCVLDNALGEESLYFK